MQKIAILGGGIGALVRMASRAICGKPDHIYGAFGTRLDGNQWV